MNVVGYRLINNYSPIKPRSFCPLCKKPLKWYDLIPVISWLNLKGQCRYCSNKISFLYPLIELLTAIIFVFLFNFISYKYWLSYSIFISALMVVIRTDLEFMLISSFTTLYLVPIGIIFAFFNLLQISLVNSILGATLGYIFLLFISKIFYKLRKKNGLGQGDIELICLIGSFTGIFGVWFSLFLGSFLGIIFSLIKLITTKNKTKISNPIPFGPWLSISAIIFLFLI